ncbi:diacylglycerol/lipid kinase family protein [Prevotella denticola]|nr:diacylglycerol kinase family protein [Prevotella denticola]KGF38648.1 diacylglycerol kinase [Prevotella denticola DNF00960]MBF1388858.1 diacylglycerol kinase family lipid kinase [Prevotella denticola]MBW4759556.1 diacylglycerol kinase family lipid kinase [Prevotella denticola]QUB88946.1 diacylglycerol kinase family lipid kinase [Prevotella denticola]QUB90172.1 diacylglycerol kinase family lipid kinase [Prevotella denticola]
MNKKKIIFILNPISGTVSKAGIPGLIEERLDKEKFDCRIAETKYAGHATELAQQAARQGIDIVVAVGGDGTVNEVGRALVNTKTAMGILPCGSGNGLARHLNLPMNLKKCIDILNDCDIHTLDYGLINRHPFFCTCGMGFDAFISMKFAEAGKRGPITYMQKILEEGLSYQPETYEIEDEEGTRRYKAFLVSAANASQYGNNAYIAPQASMSDGLLDIIIMEPFDLIEAPQVAIELFNKTLDKNLKIKTFRASHIHIHRKSEGIIHYDGDPVMADADVDISIVPKGINIIVNPKGTKDYRQPNILQTAFSELFYNIDLMRQDITKQGRKVQALNKNLLRKLNM